MLEMTRVRFAHPGRAPTLDGLDLHLPRGEAVRLAGESGAGKSTVLDLAAGIIPRVTGGRLAGTVTLDGDPVASLPAPTLAARVGHAPQDPETAFVARTVHAELAGLLANVGAPREEIPRRVEQALAAFDAIHLVHRETATLSGGEAARVALAAAVAAEPPLLLLDEPHAQLDPTGRQALASTLRGLTAGGRSMLVAAHDPHPFDAVVDRTRRLDTDHDTPPIEPLPDPERGRPLLTLDGVEHAYDGGPTVGPIDLEITPGEVVALTGPNGAGKTTALNAAAGLIDPTHGRVDLAGEDPRTLAAPERARRVGVAFQHPAWHITQDTLRDEVALTADRLGRPADPARTLDAVGLAPLAEVHPWDLSGGQRQRMAVATAVAHQPPLVLLDEPTRGLDAANRHRLAQLLAERTRQGKATLVASHHPWLAEIAHRTVTLDPPRARDPATPDAPDDPGGAPPARGATGATDPADPATSADAVDPEVVYA